MMRKVKKSALEKYSYMKCKMYRIYRHYCTVTLVEIQEIQYLSSYLTQ